MIIPGVSGQQALPPLDRAFRTKINSWLPTARTLEINVLFPADSQVDWQRLNFCKKIPAVFTNY